MAIVKTDSKAEISNVSPSSESICFYERSFCGIYLIDNAWSQIHAFTPPSRSRSTKFSLEIKKRTHLSIKARFRRRSTHEPKVIDFGGTMWQQLIQAKYRVSNVYFK